MVKHKHKQKNIDWTACGTGPDSAHKKHKSVAKKKQTATSSQHNQDCHGDQLYVLSTICSDELYNMCKQAERNSQIEFTNEVVRYAKVLVRQQNECDKKFVQSELHGFLDSIDKACNQVIHCLVG